MRLLCSRNIESVSSSFCFFVLALLGSVQLVGSDVGLDIASGSYLTFDILDVLEQVALDVVLFANFGAQLLDLCLRPIELAGNIARFEAYQIV